MDDNSQIGRLLLALGLGQLGQHRFVSVRGRGRKGVLCRYVDDHGEDVAVKFLIIPPDQKAIISFDNEAKALAHLSDVEHRVLGGIHIPKAHSQVFKHPSYPIHYFLLEYIHGETLKELVDSKSPPWAPWDSINLIRRIASALISFHALGWIHMDLNLGNIMVDREFDHDVRKSQRWRPGVTILDLGNAVHYFETLPDGFNIEGRKFEFPFKPVGNPDLSALELFINPKQADQQADAFTLGTIFYFLLTREYPYQAQSFGMLVEKKKRGKFEHIITSDENLDNFLNTFFDHMLSPHPGRRFNVGEITTMMDDLLFRDAHKMGENFLRMYFACKGDVVKCMRCGALMHPELHHWGEQCPHCWFTIPDGDGWLDWR